jgi:hypothetical protein
VAAGVGQGEHGEGLGRLPAGRGEAADPALQAGHALLHHLLRRVHDAGVDVARLGQGKQGGGVIGVPERIARRHVDRRRPRSGGRVGGGTGVDLAGLETLRLRTLRLGTLGLAHGFLLWSWWIVVDPVRTERLLTRSGLPPAHGV